MFVGWLDFWPGHRRVMCGCGAVCSMELLHDLKLFFGRFIIDGLVFVLKQAAMVCDNRLGRSTTKPVKRT